MVAVIDPEFNPPVKSKPRNTRMPSIRRIGQLASVVLLGGLAILPAQNASGRWRKQSKLPPRVLLTPNGYQPWMSQRIASDHFVRSAPAGIDERFLVTAPAGIDEGMIVNPYPAVGSRPVLVAPVPYPDLVPVPVQPAPSR